jgi:hypothetical protein
MNLSNCSRLDKNYFHENEVIMKIQKEYERMCNNIYINKILFKN